MSGDSQRVEGLELSLAGKLTDAWHVIGSYAYQDGGPRKPSARHPLAGDCRRHRDTPSGCGIATTYRRSGGSAWAHLSRPVLRSISNAVTLKSYTGMTLRCITRSTGICRRNSTSKTCRQALLPSAHNDSNITPGSPRGAYLGMTFKF